MKKIIDLRNITVSYGDNTILENLNLYINEKEFITLLGPSGCGKTTTLRAIAGFVKVDSGDVIFEGAAAPGICLPLLRYIEHRVAAVVSNKLRDGVRVFCFRSIGGNDGNAVVRAGKYVAVSMGLR